MPRIGQTNVHDCRSLRKYGIGTCDLLLTVDFFCVEFTKPKVDYLKFLIRFDLFFILVDECNELIDYSIARKIIDLHKDADLSVNRVYSEDDIRRYLNFSRSVNCNHY